MTHGKASSYRNGCRCAECREAFRVAHMAWRRRTGQRPFAEYLAARKTTVPPHGTETRYVGHGCRCEDCKRASREARARRRAKVSS